MKYHPNYYHQPDPFVPHSREPETPKTYRVDWLLAVVWYSPLVFWACVAAWWFWQ